MNPSPSSGQAASTGLDSEQIATAAPGGPSSDPNASISSDPPTIEDRLFTALDEAAVTILTDIMSDKSIDTESALPATTVSEKVAAFKAAIEWLTKRQKIRPDKDASETPGVEAMRALIAETNRDMGVIMKPPKKPGRPTKAEVEDRRLYLEVTAPESIKSVGSDDTKFQRMLARKGVGPVHETEGGEEE